MAKLNPISVTVVIVNYNGGDHILKCLSTLENQSFTPSEVVVVDNNSSDGSNELIKTKFPLVRLIELTKNIGFAGGNNKAFATITDVVWVALLNPDTIPRKNWLECLTDGVQENSECEIFASQLIDANNVDCFDGTGDIYHVCGLSWRRHYGLSLSQSNLCNDQIFSPCAAAALYKLDTINAVGGFDESYFCYHEDVDMVFRMRSIGAQCAYVESAVVAHVGSGLTGLDSDFSVYHGHRNLVWTYFKNMPGWSVIWYFPQHLLLNIVTLVYYTLRGRGRIILKSKWHAIKGLGHVFQQRKLIQAKRTVNSIALTNAMNKGVLRPYFSRFR